jgi:DUF2938 family protein
MLIINLYVGLGIAFGAIWASILNSEIGVILMTGVVAGISGTLAMDSLNLLFSRTGMLSKIDIGMIGRMAAGWTHGRFCYGHPSEMKQVRNEKLYGYIAHYAIGISLAIPYVLGWVLFIGGSTSPIWAIPYGILSTIASWFFVYPSMGFGLFGRRSPEGLKAALSSLSNHLFFGVGMAIGVLLV